MRHLRKIELQIFRMLRTVSRLFHPNATTAATALGIIREDLDARSVKSVDHLRECIDHASDIAFARFHALNGWK